MKMKTPVPTPRPSRRVSRRDFLAGTTAGLTAGLLLPSIDLAAQRGRGRGGDGEGAVAPSKEASAPLVPPPASFPGTGKYLYVTSDEGRRVNVYNNTTGQHAFLWSFAFAGPGGRAAGCCADAASQRYFVSHVSDQLVTCYDMLTGKTNWQVNTSIKYGLRDPDRLGITMDGKALFVPMNISREKGPYGGWANHVNLVLDAATGEKIGEVPRPGRPHNNWTGEAGKYMYLGGRSDQTLVVADQKTYKFVKNIGPFNWPVRQMQTDTQERYVYLTLTRTRGFGVADVNAGKVLPDVTIDTPKERTKYWTASSTGGGANSLPHGDNPWSHGIAMRPLPTEELLILDDEWGYVYVLDVKANRAAPKLKGRIELFSKIDEPWMADSGRRWLDVSLDGKWLYPSSGQVVDLELGKVTSMKIAPSEKLLEVEFRDGKAIRNTGQQGGVYGRT